VGGLPKSSKVVVRSDFISFYFKFGQNAKNKKGIYSVATFLFFLKSSPNFKFFTKSFFNKKLILLHLDSDFSLVAFLKLVLKII